METKYLRADHFTVYFDRYFGTKLSDYPVSERPHVIEVMKKALSFMEPAPNPIDIYVERDSVTVLWFFPCPIYLKSLDELDEIRSQAEDFIATNPVCQGTCSVSYQDYEVTDYDLKSYMFYRRLGLSFGVK